MQYINSLAEIDFTFINKKIKETTKFRIDIGTSICSPVTKYWFDNINEDIFVIGIDPNPDCFDAPNFWNNQIMNIKSTFENHPKTDNYYHLCCAIDNVEKPNLAKRNNQKQVEFWGDGSSLRQFSYAEDVARDLIFLMENSKSEDTINIGNYEEYSIKTLVVLAKQLIGYDGELIWNFNKPNGQLKKTVSTKLFETLYASILNEEPKYHTLEEGLRKTIAWFVTNYPNIRGAV